MGACSKQLQNLLKGERSSLVLTMTRQTSQPIEPIIKKNSFVSITIALPLHVHATTHSYNSRKNLSTFLPIATVVICIFV